MVAALYFSSLVLPLHGHGEKLYSLSLHMVINTWRYKVLHVYACLLPHFLSSLSALWLTFYFRLHNNQTWCHLTAFYEVLWTADITFPHQCMIIFKNIIVCATSWNKRQIEMYKHTLIQRDWHKATGTKRSSHLQCPWIGWLRLSV